MTDDNSLAPPPPGERVSVLALSGELDYDTGRGLTDSLQEAIAGGSAVLAVDLSRVSFADSFALRALVLAQRGIEDAGGRMVLVGPLAPAVLRLFEITSTDGFFTVVGSVEEAERAASAARPSGAGPL
ncbi:STAS domain-containing protein [Kitasatospora sp. NPDC006697]|uniref:STAS domain-containing protein n=1 Tax=Kitasatospora sp. NPDC006697 TaxID=3364020 RepID=UPI0036B7D50D